MSIYEILPALDLTQSVHAKISIGMHWGVKFKISRIPLIGLETRLGWRTDRKFLRNPNLNEIILLEDVSESCSIKPLNQFQTIYFYIILASSKWSYLDQTCELAKMASTWMEILAKIIFHSLLASWRAVVSHTAFNNISVISW